MMTVTPPELDLSSGIRRIGRVNKRGDISLGKFYLVGSEFSTVFNVSYREGDKLDQPLEILLKHRGENYHWKSTDELRPAWVDQLIDAMKQALQRRR